MKNYKKSTKIVRALKKYIFLLKQAKICWNKIKKEKKGHVLILLISPRIEMLKVIFIYWTEIPKKLRNIIKTYQILLWKFHQMSIKNFYI